MEEIIRVENLTHTYGEGTPFCRSAVQDMSLAIYRGEFLGIIGHTGSGKSTLIQHLNGLLKPTSGRILLGGEDIWADPKKIRNVRFRVGLVFQYPEYQLFEETVYRDIAFGPKNMGLSEEEIRTRVLRAAGFAGVDESLLEKSPFDLSTSHHAHQELVKGLTTEMAGPTFGIMNVAEYYEMILMLGIVALFFLNENWWSWPLAIVMCLLVFFLEILWDNVSARVKWRTMLDSCWIVTLLSAGLNGLILMLIQ